MNKKKTQTIRPAWIISESNKIINIKPTKKLPRIKYTPSQKKVEIFQIKPPRYKVGDKVRLYWKQRSKYKWFCRLCGEWVDAQEKKLYVLVNFNSTFKDDLYRCNVLWNEYKILPFVMSFKGKHPLQRWANRRFIKYTSWENYDVKKTH